MKPVITHICELICLGILSLFLLPAAAENEQIYHKELIEYQNINWSKYTLSALKNKVPDKTYGKDVSLIPIQSLYFLPTVNLIAMQKTWKKNNVDQWPHVIVIANGVYSLKKIAQLIADPSVFKKIKHHQYISYRPIYVAPTASLIINQNELRLSIQDGVFMMSHGKVYIVDSTVTSWDESENNYGIREFIPKEKLLYYGEQIPRPYLLGLTNSEFFIGNSLLRGLGYKGRMGTFGLSMNTRMPLKNKLDLSEELRRMSQPTGWLIGNTFEHNFFGFFSNNAKDVVIVGNIFKNNVIYNIDPHDYSDNLLIARNISYNAKYSHGIIISREVNHTAIADNIIINNHGSGIMLDRNSEHNLIYNNLSMENQGSGISIFESDNNSLLNNTIARNHHNGIFVRNSCDIDIQQNHLFRNLKSGSEVSVVNIDHTETRDFKLDPYHQLGSAKFINNSFDGNLANAIISKNQPEVILKTNLYHDSGPSYFAGGLTNHNRAILSRPANKEFIYKGMNRCQ